MYQLCNLEKRRKSLRSVSILICFLPIPLTTCYIVANLRTISLVVPWNTRYLQNTDRIPFEKVDNSAATFGTSIQPSYAPETIRDRIRILVSWRKREKERKKERKKERQKERKKERQKDCLFRTFSVSFGRKHVCAAFYHILFFFSLEKTPII